jgi:hypothetical protein
LETGRSIILGSLLPGESSASVIEGEHTPFLWPRFAWNVAITGQFPDPKELKIICVLNATRDEEEILRRSCRI